MEKRSIFLKMEKMPEIVLAISLQFDISIDWDLWQNKPCCFFSHPFNANRLRCQTKKWADMGTYNTECIYGYIASRHSFPVAISLLIDLISWILYFPFLSHMAYLIVNINSLIPTSCVKCIVVFIRLECWTFSFWKIYV